MTARIRVLVVDDSAYSRKAISRILSSSPLVEVVGAARDGEDALRKLFDLEPDLATIDLEMPRMDGYTFLRLCMRNRPTPVIAISSRSGDEDVFKALDLGAVDFISKPTPTGGRSDLESIERELIRKVHCVRTLRMDRVSERIATQPPLLGRAASGQRPRVVVIGSSTGGPAALMQIFGAFAEPPPCAFVIAQHMPVGFTAGFADRLDRLTPLRAREASGGEMLQPGEILVSPGGRHLCLEIADGDPLVRLEGQGSKDRYAPSVDRLFSSAAKAYGEELLAIVLTGMGDDGAQGVRDVKESGGQVVAESEESAVVFGMPQQAIRSGAVDRILPLGRIAESIQYGIKSVPKQGGQKRTEDFA
ncbi:MAG: chemotaxis response regulator protein-glutamate methylesterase [Myxococcota bacterium]